MRHSVWRPRNAQEKWDGITITFSFWRKMSLSGRTILLVSSWVPPPPHFTSSGAPPSYHTTDGRCIFFVLFGSKLDPISAISLSILWHLGRISSSVSFSQRRLVLPSSTKSVEMGHCVAVSQWLVADVYAQSQMNYSLTRWGGWWKKQQQSQSDSILVIYGSTENDDDDGLSV